MTSRRAITFAGSGRSSGEPADQMFRSRSRRKRKAEGYFPAAAETEADFRAAAKYSKLFPSGNDKRLPRRHRARDEKRHWPLAPAAQNPLAVHANIYPARALHRKFSRAAGKAHLSAFIVRAYEASIGAEATRNARMLKG